LEVVELELELELELEELLFVVVVAFAVCAASAQSRKVKVKRWAITRKRDKVLNKRLCIEQVSFSVAGLRLSVSY
jgi:hypothetical protein